MCFLDMLQRRQSVDRLSYLLLRDSQFVKALQVEPKFRGRSEEMSEPKGPPAVQDFGDAVGWNIELPRERCVMCAWELVPVKKQTDGDRDDESNRNEEAAGQVSTKTPTEGASPRSG